MEYERFEIKCRKCGSADVYVSARHDGYPEVTPCLVTIECNACDEYEARNM